MYMTLRKKSIVFLIISFLTVSFQGCAAFGLDDKVDPTLSALSTSVAQTATAAKRSGGSVDSLATAQFEATVKSANINATQTAQSVGRTEAQLAQATLEAPVISELPLYNVDPSKGRLGWVQGPLVLEITGYSESKYGNDKPEVTAADFAMAADVTWDTQYGSSGCGFMFRSNGDQNKPSQYMIIATRFANGHVIFMALADGEIANIHDYFPKTNDKSFAWQNGTTNRFAIVARGNLIEIYTNGEKIGEVDTTKPPTQLPIPPAPIPPIDQSDLGAMQAYEAQIKEFDEIIQQSQASFQKAVSNYNNRVAIFDEGFLAMFAVSESGRTSCTFDNAWLWLIEP